MLLVNTDVMFKLMVYSFETIECISVKYCICSSLLLRKLRKDSSIKRLQVLMNYIIIRVLNSKQISLSNDALDELRSTWGLLLHFSSNVCKFI